MKSVRLLLTLAIALHLSGVPAVAALPCAMNGEVGHHCCLPHQTETNVTTIGHCACPTPAQTGDVASAVSTVAPSPEKAAAPMAVAAGLAGFVSASSHHLAAVASTTLHPSPPPLTAVGLRC